jgi:dihydrofolate reductase
MGSLQYLMLASLDGYARDASGSFDWAVPDDEVHAAVNDASRDVATFLYGRSMYEVMTAWQTIATDPDDPVPAPVHEWAQLWRGADKVVYSATLDAVSTPHTRLVRRFDADEVRALKESADRDLAVSGPTLAAAAFESGLVDEVRLFLAPVTVGGGLPVLPRDRSVDLELTGERRFASGVVELDYTVRSD